jgi:hypothetical protein
MKVTELTRDELTELKTRYYSDLLDQRGETPSYGELSAIDELVTDEEVYQEYADVDFVEEDFFGNI